MPFATRWFWIVAGAVLAIASAVSLALLDSGQVFPSMIRNPLSQFVQPGATLWWLTLGGPFRSIPSSPGGIAFAAAANAASWLLLLWAVAAVARKARRMFATSRADSKEGLKR